MAKGAFPETHELHFGWPGMHGPKWSNLAMNTCDLLVAVGARFDDRVTGKLDARSRPGATVVHLDIDAAEIGKLRRADVPVVGPLKQVLADLADAAARCDEAARRHRAVAAPARGLARGVPAPLRQRRRCSSRRRVLETLQRADRRPRRRDLDDRRRPAPDVGDAVPPLRPAADASSPRAGSGRWATASRRRSARRRPGRTRRSSASTATAASR